MKRYAFATAVLVLVVFPWRQTPQADTAAYTVEPLGNLTTIDGLVPAETGINASGEVVGTVSDNSLGTRAVRYTDANGWEYVPGLTWGSTAAAVNAHGDIVGTKTANSQSHAYRYNAANNSVDDIALLPAGDFSEGVAINDNGDVAGDGTTTGGAQLAFVASRDHAPVVLPDPGAGFAQACGINNAGQVAMTIFTAQFTIHAARFETNSTYTDIGPLDGDPNGFSTCFGMDQLGNVGGQASANGTFPGYRFDGTSTINVLTGLPWAQGNVESLASGSAAGWFVSTLDNLSHAMLYTDANGAVDLNQQIPSDSGWFLSEIKGINASGQMVGDGTFNGVRTVFRLSRAKTKDTTPPVIAAHGDETAEASAPSGAIVPYTAPATSDNVDANGTATCAPVSGSVFALGTTTVTCNATDAAGNAAVPTTFNVVVRDTTPPVITAHGDVTAEAAGASGASVTFSAPATNDAVDGSGTATCAPASGSSFALGATTVTCSASDAAGNASAPTAFSVVVKDTTAPAIAAHGDVTAEATGPNGASVAYNAPTTTDAVDGSRAATCTPASGSTFALGTSTVTCNASDAAGNAAAPTNFKVVVKDATAPVIAAHGDVTAEATGPGGATVTYAAPSTTDGVDGSGTATCAPASGATFPLGTTTVTCHASDAAGNAAALTTFKVCVKDTTAPVISRVSASPATVAPVDGRMVPVTVSASAADNSGWQVCKLSGVSGPGSLGADYAITGSLTGTVKAVGGRTYSFTVTCSDASGNSSTGTANVGVPADTTAPVISSVSASPSTIAAAASQMRPVTVSVSASDDSGVVSCRLASVSGGTTGVDSQITGQFTASVKAVAGRNYSLLAQCTDFSGNSSFGTANVLVSPDTTAPVISSVYASPDAIWPPNGKMEPVSVTVTATDDIDPSPSCALTSISGTAGSSAITGQFSASVRSDNGAAYTLTVTCTDFSGNKSSAAASVVIAKTNGNGGTPKANGKQVATTHTSTDNR